MVDKRTSLGPRAHATTYATKKKNVSAFRCADLSPRSSCNNATNSKQHRQRRVESPVPPSRGINGPLAPNPTVPSLQTQRSPRVNSTVLPLKPPTASPYPRSPPKNVQHRVKQIQTSTASTPNWLNRYEKLRRRKTRGGGRGRTRIGACTPRRDTRNNNDSTTPPTSKRRVTIPAHDLKTST